LLLKFSPQLSAKGHFTFHLSHFLPNLFRSQFVQPSEARVRFGKMNDGLFSKITSLFSISDEQAMWRVQTQDDAEAFAQLVSRWQHPMQNLCARMTGDVHRGEDLAQETFVRLYAKRKDYQPSAKFSTYLWRIALNLCYDELRRINRRREISTSDDASKAIIELEQFSTPEPEPAVVLEAQERANEVKHALLQLPEIYRTILVLRHYENLKFREIAEVLEIPEGTAKSRMAEALDQMSHLLKPAFAEESKLKVKGTKL
jgi:RNA polymerase sigma-70 factor (ECF subfamily)